MVLFELVRGRKSGRDLIIRVYSYGEVWHLGDVLQFLKIIFDSEKCNYPIEKGFRGQAYFLNAITEVAFGRDLELVLKAYKLPKGKVQIIEKKAVKLQRLNPIMQLHELGNSEEEASLERL